MHHYDFLAALALPDNEQAIDQAVEANGGYGCLRQADWTTRAQVLTTGLVHGKRKEKAMEDCIKNGRQGNTRKGVPPIGGYPALLKRCRPPAVPPEIRSLCTPDSACMERLPAGSVLVSVKIRLTRPWHSKDDRAFYPHENPVRRDWVFQAPFLAPSGIKGLLRWAWRMAGNTDEPLEEAIFGTANDTGGGTQGCLVTWPLFWEGNAGLEVLNPQDRTTLAGTKPIKYEVVQAGGRGTLHLLLWNRRMEEPAAFVRRTVLPVLDALHLLLAEGGLSAKRSADWGAVRIEEARIKAAGIAPASPDADAGEDMPWAAVTGPDGTLKPFDDPAYTKEVIASLSGMSKTQVRKRRDEAFQVIERRFAEHRQHREARADATAAPAGAPPPRPAVLTLSKPDLPSLKAALEERRAMLDPNPKEDAP